MIVDRAAVVRYRLVVNHLTAARVVGFVAAAHGGLQDGSPRSAVLSLYARSEGVTADSWRHPDLAQVFGPRGAIYVVPRIDVGVFSYGLLPRNRSRLEELRSKEDRVHGVLGGASMRQSDVLARLPSLGGARELRWVATLGTLTGLWDTIDTLVVPTNAPEIDIEDARHELARRFFRYFGPATAADLAWWVAGHRADAEQTIDGIRHELFPVGDGEPQAWVAASTSELLTTADAPHRVLLLPPDDTYISRHMRHELVPEPVRQRQLWPKAPPPGALVVNGEVAGTWRRRRRRVVVTPWRAIDSATRSAAEHIVTAWPLPDPPADADVEWLDPI